MLRLSDLSIRFGGLSVLDGVSLALRPGDRRAIIGPNGAGKTTLLNLVTGRLRPQRGRIVFAGRDVTRLPPHRRARMGLVRTFQITSLFASFSALENVALAVAEREGLGLSLGTSRGFPSAVADEAEAVGRQIGLDTRGLPVRMLAYGEQRLVEFAVALALRPRVLLLDEPAAGLSPADHDRLMAALDALPSGAAVLLIEHDMGLVFRFARQITVLAGGGILADGTPQEIERDPKVRDVYLGRRR